MKTMTDYTSQSASSNALHTLLGRRSVLHLLALSPFSGLLHAQQNSNVIGIEKLHTFGLRVTDVARSADFYQRLFGMPVQARDGDSVCLRIGDGPQFLSLSPCQAGEAPGITHIGLSVIDGNREQIEARLSAHGMSPATQAPDVNSPLHNAMQFWSPLAPEAGVFLADREGLVMQLCAPTYCGAPDSACGPLEAASNAGLLRLREINHFTNFMSHAPAANQFYMDLFGLRYQSYQGPTMPTIGVGDGRQFLMFVGGAQDGAPRNPARIDHVSLSVDDFDVERILAKLTAFGLSARQDSAVTPPLSHWISLRMPNRGGAVDGTPELYFSDPDGLHIQLQHVSYCGGGGYLGDECAPLP